MTVSELERYAGLVPGPDEIADMVLNLIADWRAMRAVLGAVLSVEPPSRGQEHDIIRTALSNLNLKP